jgi:O-antigen/teichoic acid export membrane protein
LRRFLRNLSANSVGIFINLFSQLFSIPLFLHNWNKELYGEWIVLTAVPNLLWSLEGGLGILAASRMTLAAAVHDWKAANEIFQTTLLGQILVSTVLFGGALVFASTVNIAAFFGFHSMSASDAALILVVMISYMLLGLILSVYRAAYRASELEPRGSMLSNFWRATDLAIIIFVLSYHGKPVQLAECMLVGILVWIVIGYIDVRYKCSNVRFGFTFISWMRFKEIVIHGLPLLVGQLTSALYMQGFPLVVNRSLGPAAVVMLTTIRTVSRIGLLPIQTIAFSSSPQLSRSFGSQNRLLFSQLLKIIACACIWSSLASTVGLTIFGPWLMSKWTGGRLNVDHITLFLFTLSISFQGVWSCCAVILGSCNKHHLFYYFSFCITIVSLGAALFATKLFGFIAVPVIMGIADLFIAGVGLYLCKKKIDFYDPHPFLCVFQISFYKDIIVKILNREGNLKAVRN